MQVAESGPCDCRKLDQNISMMQAVQERRCCDVPGRLNRARDRRILVERDVGP